MKKKAKNPVLFLFFAPRITSWIIRQESENEERNKKYYYCVNKEFESKHYTISKIIFFGKKRIDSLFLYHISYNIKYNLNLKFDLTSKTQVVFQNRKKKNGNSNKNKSKMKLLLSLSYPLLSYLSIILIILLYPLKVFHLRKILIIGK